MFRLDPAPRQVDPIPAGTSAGARQCAPTSGGRSGRGAKSFGTACFGRRRVGLAALLAVVVVVGALAGRPASVAGHAELERADPPVNGLLAAAPARIELWLSEAVDQGAGSPSIRLLDGSERNLSGGQATVDPADPRHVVLAGLPGLGPGTYTVAWSARSAVDGHTLAGTYGFRVGAARAPGAVTVEGEQPAWWAVAIRWLAFLGTALATGGFAFARVVVPGETTRATNAHARSVAVVAGAAVALLATLSEPWLQTLAPVVADGRAPTLAEAIRGAPAGWWLRLVALVLLAAVALARLLLARRLARAAIVEWLGLGLGLAALLGLSLTSHGAARATLMPLALASNALHQWAIALWVGGLVQLVIAWPALRAADQPARSGRRRAAAEARAVAEGEAATRGTADPVRRFSRLALALAIVAVGTGVLNAGLVLPSLQSLWDNIYGRVLLLKVLVLTPVLALATFHRLTLRRAIARLGAVALPGWSIRAETALALAVVFGGSLLTLMAPPGTGAATPLLSHLDLAAPLPKADGSLGGSLHLELQPAKPGRNAVVVRLAAAEDADEEEDGAMPKVEVAFAPIDHAAAKTTVSPAPDALGAYAIGGVELPGEGWWQATVSVTPPTGSPTGATFFFALPDPNVTGRGPVPGGNDPAAEAVFRRGLASMAALHRLRYTSQLTSGSGELQYAATTLSDGSDGNPPGDHLVSPTFERIIVGDRTWSRVPGQPWNEGAPTPLLMPADWGKDYVNTYGFRLGPLQELDGEVCQVITFAVPAQNGKVPAWYVWWVGTESGQVRGEAMVSTLHYMLYHFMEFDAPVTITPPADAPPAAHPTVPAASGS